MYFPALIIEYLAILMAGLFSAMGVKAVEKVKSLSTNPEKKDETGS